MSVEALLARLRELDINLLVEGDDLRVSAPKGALDHELRDEIDANKAAIIALPPIEAQPAQDHYPLTYAQNRLWLMHRMVDDTSIYNIFGCLRLRGALDVDAMRYAIDQTVMRHDALRTRFVFVDVCANWFARRAGRPSTSSGVR